LIRIQPSPEPFVSLPFHSSFLVFIFRQLAAGQESTPSPPFPEDPLRSVPTSPGPSPPPPLGPLVSKGERTPFFHVPPLTIWIPGCTGHDGGILRTSFRCCLSLDFLSTVLLVPFPRQGHDPRLLPCVSSFPSTKPD